MRYIVVTDLDGTLLDHQTYEFTPALSAIKELAQQDIPIILNSSKTRAEILEIRSELNNQEPFVCENGGVLCGIAPESNVLESTPKLHIQYLGTPRSQFLASLDELKAKLHLNYQGFADAPIDDVVQWTGLTFSDAQKAVDREATEPLLWQDTELALEQFRQELKALELQCVKGGRFHHVMGNFHKASCFAKLKAYYSRHLLAEVQIIALGDSQNDLPMLEQADHAIVIPAKHGLSLKPNNKSTFFASQAGPYGWQEGINHFLTSLGVYR